MTSSSSSKTINHKRQGSQVDKRERKKREKGRRKKEGMLNKLGVRRKEGKPRKKSTGRL